jgi:hypothetical protein
LSSWNQLEVNWFRQHCFGYYLWDSRFDLRIKQIIVLKQRAHPTVVQLLRARLRLSLKPNWFLNQTFSCVYLWHNKSVPLCGESMQISSEISIYWKNLALLLKLVKISIYWKLFFYKHLLTDFFLIFIY